MLTVRRFHDFGLPGRCCRLPAPSGLLSFSSRRHSPPRINDGDPHGNTGNGLPPPTIVYSDNHLLVVNKPAGWHSVPNHPNDSTSGGLVNGSQKCLVTQLKSMRLGGGSKSDFLLPLHRIDQPCTGILMLGKTSKAASRITKLWKQKGVEKEYLCVVPSSRLGRLTAASAPPPIDSVTPAASGSDDTSTQQQSHGGDQFDGNQWYELQGRMLRQSRSGSRSVIILPVSGSLPALSPSEEIRTRKVELLWRRMDVRPATSSATSIHPAYALILVRTFQGARHMVRALLAQIGQCPIAGDCRYGQSSSIDPIDRTRSCRPLKDQSVALHAFRIRLDKDRLSLGSLETSEFQAPIPATWKAYFGIRQDAV